MSSFSKWDADEIVPMVWVGPMYCADMVSQLYSRNIRFICTATIPPPSLQPRMEREAADRRRHRLEQRAQEEQEGDSGDDEDDDQDDEDEFQLAFKFCHIAVRDEPDEQLHPHFERVSLFIEEALAQKTGVLVHCMAGVSRSPTFVAAWLIRCRGMSAANAVALVMKQRQVAQPRPEFIEQLVRWDRSCNHTSACCRLA